VSATLALSTLVCCVPALFAVLGATGAVVAAMAVNLVMG
jgi:hypothetical protein